MSQLMQMIQTMNQNMSQSMLAMRQDIKQNIMAVRQDNQIVQQKIDQNNEAVRMEIKQVMVHFNEITTERSQKISVLDEKMARVENKIHQLETVMGALQRKYGNEHLKQIHKLKLKNRVQKNGQPLQEYAADIE